MRFRPVAPWVALVIVVVAAFAYSVGAQTVVIGGTGAHQVARLVLKAMPEGRDVRSYFAEVGGPGTNLPAAPVSVDLTTVPAGRVLVITHVGIFLYGSGGGTESVQLLENGPSGIVRAIGGLAGVTGIPFAPGATVTVAAAPNYGTAARIVVSGYLADA